MELMHLFFYVRCALLVAFSISYHREREQYFQEIWDLRFVLLSNFTGSSFVSKRELVFVEIEPRLHHMLAENWVALLLQITACGMENLLTFQQMLDFMCTKKF